MGLHTFSDTTFSGEKVKGIVCFYEVKCVMANVYRADIEQKRESVSKLRIQKSFLSH